MKHRIDFSAQWVQVGRGGLIKGGNLTGFLIFENDLTAEQLDSLPAKDIGKPCIEYIKSQKRHEKKSISSITTQVIY